MALKVYDDSKKRICTLKGYKDRKITKTLSSGDEEIEFYYPTGGKFEEKLKLENYIRTERQEYVIKKKEPGKNWTKYTCSLNVEELESYNFPYGFESETQTIDNCLNFAFKGTGWSVGKCEITKKRTINIENCTRPWDILKECLKTYDAECKINTLKKTVDIYGQIGSDKGAYFVEGLNLKELTLTNDTYNFYTRIMPVGADGITLGGIYGSDYLENYTYSKKEKTYVWVDERYTHTEQLREDGLKKLEKLSKPYKAYNAKVIDLASRSEIYKNILDFDIGDTVTLISKTTGIKEKQRIVKLAIYPEAISKNEAELSNETQTYSQLQSNETESAVSDAIRIANKKAKAILKDEYWTKEEVESHITSSLEKISIGISEKYATQQSVEEKKTEAVNEANQSTDQKLESYSTTEEMQAAIDLTVENINLSVSKTYATQQSVEEKKTEAVNEANQSTDQKLESYSTTEEMQAAIDLSAKEINLSIEQNYAKKAELALTVDETTGVATISAQADCIKFASGQLIIDSEGMKLDENGNATFYGEVESTDGNRTTEIKNSVIKFYKGTDETGRIAPISWGDNYENNEGVMMSTKKDYLAIAFWNETGWTAAYVVNNGLNPDSYEERNIFYESARFANGVKVNGTFEALKNINVTREGTTEAQVNVSNGAHSGRVVASQSGKYGLFDVTNNRWIIYSDENGETKIPKCAIASDSKVTGKLYIFDETMYLTQGIYGSNLPGIFVRGGGLYVDDFMACGGTKSRAVNTKNYGTVCLNAFETPTPYFGDIGSGTIGESGSTTIFMEPIFSETIEEGSGYQVILTQISKSSISHIEKNVGYFTVYGEPGAVFDWMVLAVQKGYIGTRTQEISIIENDKKDEVENEENNGIYST